MFPLDRNDGDQKYGVIFLVNDNVLVLHIKSHIIY